MTSIVTHLLPERHVPGKRLGRHAQFDERSRNYRVTRSTQPLQSVLHKRHTAIFDQGDTGSCTGNAMAGALDTAPFNHRFRETTARSIYSAATRVDSVPGSWPPDDTGSSSLAVLTVAKQRGWISGYSWAFNLDEALTALQGGPFITGIAWREGCDNPDSTGLVSYTGPVRGGHEVCAVGCDVDKRLIRFANSWSSAWGDRGFFDLTFDGYATALADQGDCGIPLPR